MRNFIFRTSNFLQNFNTFSPSFRNPPTICHSPPRFEGVQQQGSWLQASSSSFQGFHLHKSVGPLGAPVANKPPSVL